MTKKVAEKYAKIIAEFPDGTLFQNECAGLCGFLSREDITETNLAERVREVTEILRGGASYIDISQNPEFRYVMYVKDFESRGTSNSGLSHEEIMTQLRAFRSSRAEKVL